MSKSKQTYTKSGYDALVSELDYLKNTKREEVKEQIAVARSFGDLSENSEYDEARNEQAKVEARIKELEEQIENAEVVNEDAVDTTVISVGSKVTVLDDGDEEEYNIVGSNEADPASGNISDQSPIGKALIGSRAGDTVTVVLPNGGELKLAIKEVTRTHL